MVKSVCDPLTISEGSFHDVMSKLLKDHGDKVAVVNGQTGKSYTYREFEESTRRVASGLNRLGVRRGDIVALFCPNCPEYLITVFSVMSVGAATTLPNPSYTTYELCHCLKITEAPWVVTTPELYKTVAEAAIQAKSKLRGVIIINTGSSAPVANLPRSSPTTLSFSTLLADDGSWYPDIQIDAKKEIAVVPFSSGTTGLPKGVMLSHYNLTAMLTIIGSVLSSGEPLHAPDEQGVVLEFLPLYHCYGLVGVAMMSLAAGYKMVLLPRFHVNEVLGCIEKYKVTIVSMVPPTVIFLTKSPLTKNYDLSSVRRWGSGAAPLSTDSEAEFQQKFGSGEMRQGFGMTETTLAVSVSLPTRPYKRGSVGSPTPNTEMEIIDVETGKSLGPNKRGEVVARGPQIMLGYLNNPEATKAAIDSNGWLHTGDIGYYDEEGYFYIVDRIKELIKYKGFQVAPAELESLLLTHPHVDDAAVIGIPDKEAGEVPKAFVVPKPKSGLTEENVKQFVADTVSHFKHLRGGVEFLDKIPKSEAGKILRRVLRDQSVQQKSKL